MLSVDKSPAHTPLVSGCPGADDRAHAQTGGRHPAMISALSLGSKRPYAPFAPSLLLSGSFHRSQARMRLSFAKCPMTPFTYSSSRGYSDGVSSTRAPGLWTHPELWMPGIGG